MFNAFPQDEKNRPLTREEADNLLVKILITFYWINYLPFACALLGITEHECAAIKSAEDLKQKVLKIDMSFAYLNILVGQYFSPILLVE